MLTNDPNLYLLGQRAGWIETLDTLRHYTFEGRVFAIGGRRSLDCCARGIRRNPEHLNPDIELLASSSVEYYGEKSEGIRRLDAALIDLQNQKLKRLWLGRQMNGLARNETGCLSLRDEIGGEYEIANILRDRPFQLVFPDWNQNRVPLKNILWRDAPELAAMFDVLCIKIKPVSNLRGDCRKRTRVWRGVD